MLFSDLTAVILFIFGVSLVAFSVVILYCFRCRHRVVCNISFGSQTLQIVDQHAERDIVQKIENEGVTQETDTTRPTRRTSTPTQPARIQQEDIRHTNLRRRFVETEAVQQFSYLSHAAESLLAESIIDTRKHPPPYTTMENVSMTHGRPIQVTDPVPEFTSQLENMEDFLQKQRLILESNKNQQTTQQPQVEPEDLSVRRFPVIANYRADSSVTSDADLHSSVKRLVPEFSTESLESYTFHIDRRGAIVRAPYGEVRFPPDSVQQKTFIKMQVSYKKYLSQQPRRHRLLHVSPALIFTSDQSMIFENEVEIFLDVNYVAADPRNPVKFQIQRTVEGRTDIIETLEHGDCPRVRFSAKEFCELCVVADTDEVSKLSRLFFYAFTVSPPENEYPTSHTIHWHMFDHCQDLLKNFNENSKSYSWKIIKWPEVFPVKWDIISKFFPRSDYDITIWIYGDGIGIDPNAPVGIPILERWDVRIEENFQFKIWMSPRDGRDKVKLRYLINYESMGQGEESNIVSKYCFMEWKFPRTGERTVLIRTMETESAVALNERSPHLGPSGGQRRLLSQGILEGQGAQRGENAQQSPSRNQQNPPAQIGLSPPIGFLPHDSTAHSDEFQPDFFEFSENDRTNIDSLKPGNSALVIQNENNQPFRFRRSRSLQPNASPSERPFPQFSVPALPTKPEASLRRRIGSEASQHTTPKSVNLMEFSMDNGGEEGGAQNEHWSTTAQPPGPDTIELAKSWPVPDFSDNSEEDVRRHETLPRSHVEDALM